MLGRRVSAERSGGVSEAADKIRQQELVAVTPRNESLPNRAGESHKGKERNVLLRRIRKTTPQAKIRVRIRNTPPKHLLPHRIKTIGISLNFGSIQLGKLKIRIVA